MEAVLGEMQEYEVRAVDGCLAQAMAASTRNLSWETVLCELIDNGRSWNKEGQPAIVEVSFIASEHRAKTLSVVDHGVGGSSWEPFLQPGNSGAYHRASGNSTFGIGLYVVEVHLRSPMRISTFPVSGEGQIIQRDALKSDNGSGYSVPNTQEERKRWGVPASGGTKVLFGDVKKSFPNEKTISGIVATLGNVYRRTLRSGELKLTIRRNNKEWLVVPAEEPQLVERFEKQVVANGHTFNVSWGVTTAFNRVSGAELFYGGKRFDVTPIPCGEYNIKHFHGDIEIPRSIGREGMDLLKRGVDAELMAPVYDECEVLFREALEESHRLSSSKELDDVNKALSAMLSDITGKGDEDGEGEEDIRTFKGRNPEGIGITPKDSGRTRRGRSGSGRRNKKQDGPVAVCWQPLGENADIATYDVNCNRLTYNEENAKALLWRESARLDILAVIGAAVMADATRVRSEDTGYATFGYQLTKFCNRRL